MPTYITVQECREITGIDSVTEQDIKTAESDLDDIALGHHPRSNKPPFRKLNPGLLSPMQADALKRATAEQVKYRKIMGNRFFDKQQFSGSVSQPGITVERNYLPLIKDRVLMILVDAGLRKQYRDRQEVLLDDDNPRLWRDF